ncbi:MAG: hypothetical protein ACYTJ0_14265, partial [Planctomycetota bacterium]
MDTTTPGSGGMSDPPKIIHTGQRVEKSRAPTDEPLPIAEATGPAGLSPKIRALGEKGRHEDEWSRTPNTTGTGAIHVKSFHSKLTDDALRYMDQAINEWL